MDHLSELIHSLLPVEKKLFRQSLQSRKTPTNYLRLFNYIEKHKTASDRQIRAYFKNEIFIKQLAVAKNYLTDTLLNFLTARSTEHSITIAQTNALLEIEILLVKRCFRLAEKKLMQLKKAAYEAENFHLLVRLLEQEKSHILRFSKKHLLQEQGLKKLCNEEKKVTLLLNEFTTYANMYHLVSIYLANGVALDTRNKKAVIQLLETKVRKALHEIKSKKAVLYHFTLKNIYYQLTNNLTENYKFTKQELMFYKKHIFYLRYYPDTILAALNNHLTACNKINNLREVENLIAEIEMYKATHTKGMVFKTVYLHEHKLWYYCRINDKAAALNIAKTCLQLIHQKNKMRPDVKTQLLYLVSISYIRFGQYTAALDVLHNLHSLKHTRIENYYLSAAHYLLGITHYYMHNYTVAFAILRSAARKKNALPLYKSTLTYFRKMINGNTEKYRSEFMQKLEKSRQEYIELPDLYYLLLALLKSDTMRNR
jgi:hypothetical protein